MKTAVPLYEALAAEVESQIAVGALRPGERIPSVRSASRARRVSVSTVLEAYMLLERRGRIEARPQSGFFVRGPHAEAPPPPRSAPSVAAPRTPRVRDLVGAVYAAASAKDVVPFGAACPGPALFPSRQLNLVLRQVLREEPNHSAVYTFSPGDPELRHQLARRLSAAGGVVDPEDVIVTVGAMEALQLCLRAVAEPGDTIAIESPTYFGILECLEGLGLKALEVPTDPVTGIDLDALAGALRKRGSVKAGLFMPSFHNPLGALVPDARKRALVELCASRGVPIIEDDVYRELAHAGAPPRTLRSFDRAGNVLLCGSFSKSLGPGLRVGWAVTGRWRERVRALQLCSTLGASALQQRMLARYLARASLERHLRRLRRAFRDQVLRTTQAVQTWFPPGTRVSRPQGGFVVWIELPGRRDGLELHRRALEHGIGIAPGAMFSTTNRFRSCIRLNCGHPWSPRLEQAIATLGRLARD